MVLMPLELAAPVWLAFAPVHTSIHAAASTPLVPAPTELTDIVTVVATLDVTGAHHTAVAPPEAFVREATSVHVPIPPPVLVGKSNDGLALAAESMHALAYNHDPAGGVNEAEVPESVPVPLECVRLKRAGEDASSTIDI